MSQCLAPHCACLFDESMHHLPSGKRAEIGMITKMGSLVIVAATITRMTGGISRKRL